LGTTPVFISHATEDKDRFVLAFYERLRSKGIDAWLDTFEMLPGDKLVSKVFDEGLKQSDAVIVILSAVSVTKPFVQKELDTAVIKNIKDKTRLIPIRLDSCEVPLCLADTIYQEVSDPDKFDDEFERIVNAIYGQYERPPLGEKPLYVQAGGRVIDGLTPIDSTIFEHACRIAIEQGHTVSISGDQMIDDLKVQGISEAQIKETQEVLEGRSYVEVQYVISDSSSHVYDFGITTLGFDKFAHVGIPDYGKLCADVGRCFVRDVQNGGTSSNHPIADELKEPFVVVDHIFQSLGYNGLIKYYDNNNCFYKDVYWVSPELRRKLEGNN
jgi:hypothetical protein